MLIERTNRFKRSFKRLDEQSQKLIKRAITMLVTDFSHKSLRVKKMKGYQNPNVWEASANMDLRITFQIEKPKKLILRNCGHHDETLNNP